MSQMLFSLFQLGSDRYVIEAAQVTEIVPVVDIAPVTQAARSCVGLMNYRGTPLPVCDLGELLHGRPVQRLRSTRILVVASGARTLGLLVERATDTFRGETTAFGQIDAKREGAPWLGPIAMDKAGIIQWLQVDALP